MSKNSLPRLLKKTILFVNCKDRSMNFLVSALPGFKMLQKARVALPVLQILKQSLLALKSNSERGRRRFRGLEQQRIRTKVKQYRVLKIASS